MRFANMLLNGGEYRGVRSLSEETLDAMNQRFIGNAINHDAFFFGSVADWGLGFHQQPLPGVDKDGPFNFAWQGVGGTVFSVDPVNDSLILYMALVRDGPSGAPTDLALAQPAMYEAMLN